MFSNTYGQCAGTRWHAQRPKGQVVISKARIESRSARRADDSSIGISRISSPFWKVRSSQDYPSLWNLMPTAFIGSNLPERDLGPCHANPTFVRVARNSLGIGKRQRLPAGNTARGLAVRGTSLSQAPPQRRTCPYVRL